MDPTLIGILLIVIGFIALLAGIGGGIAQMFKELQAKYSGGFSGPLTFPVQVVEALTKFVQALAKAPLWLALTVVGILLIAWGGTML